MLGKYWLAPAALFALQVAPVGARVDSTGRFHLAFGAALGSYEERSVDCEGTVLSKQRFKHRNLGGEVEGWVAPTIRVAAHAGHMSTTPDAGEQLAEPTVGFYGGALVAQENAKVGFGIGISSQPTGDSESPDGASRQKIVPMGYGRLGTLDGPHLRVEAGGTASPGAPPDIARLGIGYGLGRQRRVGFRFDVGGAAFPHTQSRLSLGAMLRVPLGNSLDLGVAAAFRQPSGGNVGVFGRVGFGK